MDVESKELEISGCLYPLKPVSEVARIRLRWGIILVVPQRPSWLFDDKLCVGLGLSEV